MGANPEAVLVLLLQVLWEPVLLLLLPGAVPPGPDGCRTGHPAGPRLAQGTLPPGQRSHGHEGEWNLPRQRKARRLRLGCTDVVCVPQRYGEAERAMEQVLKLDTDCEEAVVDLMNCRVLQLMVSVPASKGVSC